MLTDKEKEKEVNYYVKEIIECGKQAFRILEKNPEAKESVQWIIDRCIDNTMCLELTGLLNKSYEMFPKYKDTIEMYLAIHHQRQKDKTYKGPSSFDACYCNSEEQK